MQLRKEAMLAVAKQLALLVVTIIISLVLFLATYQFFNYNRDIGLCAICPLFELWYMLVIYFVTTRMFIGLVFKEKFKHSVINAFIWPLVIVLIIGIFELLSN